MPVITFDFESSDGKLCDFETLMDTGASTNVVSLATLKSLGHRITGKPSYVKTAANTVSKALGTAKIKVFLSGTTSVLLEFTVMADSSVIRLSN